RSPDRGRRPQERTRAPPQAKTRTQNRAARQYELSSSPRTPPDAQDLRYLVREARIMSSPGPLGGAATRRRAGQTEQDRDPRSRTGRLGGEYARAAGRGDPHRPG